MYFMNRLNLDRENQAHREQLLLNDNDDPARGTEKLSHLSAAEYVKCGHISQQDFDRFYKFSFVRNPWSRLVSEYRYRNFLSHRSFKDFVMNKLPKPGWDDKYRHVMPQSEMLYDEKGYLLVDFVGKFETLQQNFDKVCEQLGFTGSQLPHINSSDKKSRELRRKARNYYTATRKVAYADTPNFTMGKHGNTCQSFIRLTSKTSATASMTPYKFVLTAQLLHIIYIYAYNK
jgi:hypothetical protein